MTKVDISNTILMSSFPGLGNSGNETFTFTIPSYTGTGVTLPANSTGDTIVGSLGGASDFIQIQAQFSPLIPQYVVCDTQATSVATTISGFSAVFSPTFYTLAGSLRMRYLWGVSSGSTSVTTPALTVTAIVYFYLAPF